MSDISTSALAVVHLDVQMNEEGLINTLVEGPFILSNLYLGEGKRVIDRSYSFT